MTSFTTLLLIIGIYFIKNADADRFVDKMYTNIESSICFRRLNASHTTGCGSSLGGSVGVLHLIEWSHDFEFVINSPPAPPYTLIIPPRLFTRQNILNLTQKAAQNIAGIVLIENRTSVFSFSHESKCPNEYGGLRKEQTCNRNDATKSWNPYGTGLLHENFPFPIIYVKDSKYIANITNCYRKFNAFDKSNQHKRSLCAIQIKSFMSAAVNSEVCMRRTRNVGNAVNPPRYCDPLQGNNIYATLFSRTKVEKIVKDTKTNESIIVIATRIDTTSMFDGLGLGAMDSLVPAVTLMSVAHTLAKMFTDDINFVPRNILFMFFNGEAYDYIGSQRFVYDMERGDFPATASQTQPIRWENIEFFIDIGSLDSLNSTTIYHYADFAEAEDFVNLMRKYNESLGFNIVINKNKTHNLPPTSSQTFLRDNQTFPAVILYSEMNKNRFYHSIYDDVKNINFEYKNTSKDFTILTNVKMLPPQDFKADSIQISIRNFSSLIAFTVYEMVTGTTYKNDLGANPYLIDELLHCYLESAKCPLFQASVKDPKVLNVEPSPLQRYISVQSTLARETIAWTYSVLGFLTGRPIPNYVADNCTHLPLAWYAGFDGQGQCYLTTQNFSNALSPAFIMDDYEWKSGRYSTWTESTWSEINVRIFVKPPLSQEAFTLAIGFAVLLISFLIVFIINTKSEVLFGESTSSINVLTLPVEC